MIKKTKVISTILGALLLLSTTVHADTGFSYPEFAWVDRGDYRYDTDSYDPQSNLQPVAKIFERGNGYADKNYNMKIPFNKDWKIASGFKNSIAVVESDKQGTCLAIDTSGRTIFKFQPNTYLSGISESNFLQAFDNDPNGMYCAYVDGNGDSVCEPNNPTLTIYDRKGNYIKKSIGDLGYDSISKFNANGIATLSIMTGSAIVGGGDLVYREYYYKGVATINTKGVISKISDPIITIGSQRISGNNRYETAAAISMEGWDQSDNVVLANGESFSNALIAAPLAYLKDTSVLITPSNKLDGNISKEIERLQAKNIFIIGNTASVSQNIENELKTKYDTIRICGEQALDAAVKVGEEIRKIKQFDTVTLINELDFPDALAMTPFSARKTMPILFTHKDSLRDDTLDALKNWEIKNVVIAGGTGVVSEKVEQQLEALGITITRLAGKDRYDTAFEIIKYFEPEEGYDNISIASGENYPDALTGAMFSAKRNMPMILVNLSGTKENMLQYLNSKKLNLVFIFGGEAVVNKNIINY